MRRTFHLAVIMALGVLMPSLGGCKLGTFEQDFDTEIQVYDPGPYVDFVRVAKTFRFSEDPGEADEVNVVGASLEVTAPEGSNLGFLDSLEVYLVLGEQEALFASTGVFDPRKSRIALDIDFEGDVREWTNDSRISMTFVAYPVRTYTDWPQGGFTVRAAVLLEVVLF